MIDPHSWRGNVVWTRSRNLGEMVIGCALRRKGGKRAAIGVD